MAVGGDRLHVFDDFFLVPDVVAGGEHVGAEVKELVGRGRRDAEAAGGVFGIDHDRSTWCWLIREARCSPTMRRPGLPKTSPTKRIRNQSLPFTLVTN